MPYFLTTEILTVGKTSEVSGAEALHILLSRRIKAGEKILLQDASGQRFEVEVLSSGKKTVGVKVLEKVSVPAEPKASICLFLAVLPEQPLDFVFQKSTELGAAEICLFNSERVATKLSLEVYNKKFSRWGKILWESAKQSERAKPPELIFLSSERQMAEKLKQQSQLILLDQNGETVKTSLMLPIKNLGLLVGPEGGFTEKEKSFFVNNHNAQKVSFGPRILRAETAALAGLAICSSILEA